MRRGNLPSGGVVAVSLLVFLAGAAGCNRAAQAPAPAKPASGPAGTLTVRSTAFAAGEAIPGKYTGDGKDVSPPLAFSGAPAGTKQLALICDDPDAPRADPWVHWVIYRIPPDANGLPEGVATTAKLAQPAGTRQGKNSWGKIGYGGPAPPAGHGVHHYHFRLYALDAEIDLPAGAGKAELLAAMKGHVVAEGELIGTYER